ncbi:MAG: tRNA (adenosine(37)-N6)-threonylcarbamoyltransferase complex ATPase subunit type 1 TsaE [Ruminococcaceae bacterium]|nr:tRNA (adenosine(37)-N6)-threonylcarbamoyltransferase complex ATPase subunit type 1 TsaE [Oscillospiraceae bacterium]
MKESSYISSSESETERVGEMLAKQLLNEGRAYAFIALFGEMGVGKTAFTRGFCRSLGIDGVHSPTYTVVNEYTEGDVPVFHFDMYRIETEGDLLSIGFDDYLARDGYALCEWSENIRPFLPDYTVTVTISRTDGDGGRKIKIEEPAKG